MKKILEKIKIVLSDREVDPKLVIMILFGLRIFLLRLNKMTLDLNFKFLFQLVVFQHFNILHNNCLECVFFSDSFLFGFDLIVYLF